MDRIIATLLLALFCSACPVSGGCLENNDCCGPDSPVCYSNADHCQAAVSQSTQLDLPDAAGQGTVATFNAVLPATDRSVAPAVIFSAAVPVELKDHPPTGPPLV